VAWDYLKTYSRPIPGVTFNESELRAIYPNGAEIRLLGSGEADSLRGLYLDAVACDEFADWNKAAWGEVVRPALADRKGAALIIGTVRGRANAFYDAYMNAEDSPNWHRELLLPDQTDSLDDDELAQLKADLDPNEYRQEIQCDWDAGLKGSYFGTEMTEAEKSGRIGIVPHDPELPVHIALDIGVGNSTVVWYLQIMGPDVRAIRCEEYQRQGLPTIVPKIKRHTEYNFGDWVVPHDARVKEWGSGKTRIEQLREYGISPIIAPNITLDEGINATRSLITRIRINRDTCFRGVEALKTYRADYSDENQVYALKPLHTWETDFADALRYFAVSQHLVGNNWGGTLDYSDMDRAVI